MRVVVTGGREFDDADFIESALVEFNTSSSITVLIHGAARGVDTICGCWAKRNDITVEPYPAQWDVHGRAAGPIRNKQMIDEGKPDVLIAFPGGRGTANMISQCRAAGVRVLLVKDKNSLFD